MTGMDVEVATGTTSDTTSSGSTLNFLLDGESEGEDADDGDGGRDGAVLLLVIVVVEEEERLRHFKHS